MNKVISFSLWGDDLKYWMGAVENVKLSRKYYPGWKCRFYIGKDSDVKLIEMLLQEDSEIIYVDLQQPFSGLFWRFYAAEDTDVMICRDTDSRLSEREAIAVSEWLSTEKCFHIMRDHPLHNVPILGGMWGCRNLVGLKALMDDYPHKSSKGDDQVFLARFIYSQVKDDAVIHDRYNLFNDGNDFPVKAGPGEFVGAAYDQYGTRI